MITDNPTKAGDHSGSDWRLAILTYEDQGRGGTIRFTGPTSRFSLWWEFAGGEALVLIGGFPESVAWERDTGIPREERDEVVRFVAERVLRDRVGPSGRWTWDGQTLTIFG